MRKSFKRVAASVLASVMALSIVAGVGTTAGAITPLSKAGKAAGKKDYDPAASYHAYVGMQQTETWIFRDPWYSDELGAEGTNLTDEVSFNDVLTTLDVSDPIKSPGTVTDAEIKGNGTYTVSITDLDDSLTTNPDAVLSMIYVDTDIPTSARDNGFEISDVKLKLDGNSVTLPEKIFYNEEEETETKLIRFDPVNTYQKDQGAYPECPSVVTPSKSMEITFTVSGMANDNPDAVEATPTPKKEDTKKATDTKKEDSSSISPAVVGGIVVGVVVVLGVVVIVARKKK